MIFSRRQLIGINFLKLKSYSYFRAGRLVCE